MKLNKIRFYLHNKDYIIHEIALLANSISEYKEYNDISITVTLKENIQTSSDKKSNVEFSAINRLDNIDILLKKIEELQKIKLAIESTLLYLDENQKKIVEMRYFSKTGETNSFTYISKILNYSTRYIKLIDKIIITKINDKYTELT